MPCEWMDGWMDKCTHRLCPCTVLAKVNISQAIKAIEHLMCPIWNVLLKHEWQFALWISVCTSRTSQWFRDKSIRMSLHNLWVRNVLSSLGFWDLLSAAGYRLNIALNPNLHFFNRFEAVRWYKIQLSALIKQQLCTANLKSVGFHKRTCTHVYKFHKWNPSLHQASRAWVTFGPKKKKKVFHYWSIKVLRSELQSARQSFSIAHP